MLNRRYYLALAIVVVVTLMLFKLPTRAAGGLKRAFGGFFLPLFGLKVSASHVADKASAAVVPRAELVKQLEASEFSARNHGCAGQRAGARECATAAISWFSQAIAMEA